MRANRRDAIAAVERLSAMTAAGLSTSEALAASSRTGGGAGRVLSLLAVDVRRGRPLSVAMRKADGLFSATEIALIRAGEASGAIGRSLELLGSRMSEDEATGRRLSSALAYPCLLVVVSFAALAFLSLAVLPSLAELYDGKTEALPATTLWMMAVGEWISASGPLSAALLALAALAFTLARRRSVVVATAWDHLLLRLPLFGHLVLSGEKARTYATMAALLEAGCDAEQALRMAAGTAGNRRLRRELSTALRLLGRGLPLSRCWQRSGLDPVGDECGLLEVAETAGDYAGAFERLAKLRAMERETALSRLTRLAEPAAVALMGAVVSAGVLAIYQPILGSASLLSGGLG